MVDKKNTIKKKVSKDDLKRLIPAWQKRDEEEVTGIFENKEHRGQEATMQYRLYPNEEITKWVFQDGERYTIPRGLMRHINENCYHTITSDMSLQVPGKDPMKQMSAGGNVPAIQDMKFFRNEHRFAFHPMEYDDEDIEVNHSDLFLPADDQIVAAK